MAMMLPDELAWLLEMLGFDWPTANEDHMMQCAQTWRDFGAQVGDIQSDAMRSAGNVTSDNYGESIDAFVEKWDKFSGGSGYLDDARQAAKVIASVFDVAAMLIIGMKIAVIIQLIVLAIQIAVAAATAVVTFGLSGVASAAMTQVSRVAIRKILKEAAQALMEAALEAVKEPFVSALEEMSKDLVAQTVNQNFGAQDGYNLGRTADAGKTAVKDGFDNFGSTLGESLRDGAGGRAGSHARGGLDSAAGNGSSSSSGGPDADAGAGASSGTGNGSGTDSGSGASGVGASGSGASGSGPVSAASGTGASGEGARAAASAPPSGDDAGGTSTSASTGDSGPTASADTGAGAHAAARGDAAPASAAPPASGPSSDRPLTPFDAGYTEQRAAAQAAASTDAGDSPSPSGAPDSSPETQTTPDTSTGPQRESGDQTAPAAVSDPQSSVPHARVDADTNTPAPTPDMPPPVGQPDPSQSINTASESATPPTPSQESNGHGPLSQTPSHDRAADPATGTDPRTQVQQPTTPPTPTASVGTPTPTDTSSPSFQTPATPGSMPNPGTHTGTGTGNDSMSHSRTSTPTFHSQSATATEAHAPTRPAPTTNPAPSADPTPSTPVPNQVPHTAPAPTPGPAANTPTTQAPGPSRHTSPTATPRTDTPQGAIPTPTRTPDRPAPTRPDQPSPSAPGPTTPGNADSHHTANKPGPAGIYAVPAPTPNNNSAAQRPGSNNQPPHQSPTPPPPHQDQPAPLSQGQSLQQIRDSLNHTPYGLLPPDPADQQALLDAVPRNPDGTPQRHPDPNGEWAQLENDHGIEQPGRSNNCLDNARAGLSTWFGDPQVSAPRTPDKNQDGSLDTMSPERDSYNNLDAWAGRPQIWAGADHPNPYARIAHQLQEAGPGSAAIIGVQWPGGGGHAFNVYNHNGQIIWVDHQTGEVSPNPIHTGAAGVRYVPFDPNGQTMDAPWEKQSTEAESGQRNSVAEPDEGHRDSAPNSGTRATTAVDDRTDVGRERASTEFQGPGPFVTHVDRERLSNLFAQAVDSRQQNATDSPRLESTRLNSSERDAYRAPPQQMSANIGYGSTSSQHSNGTNSPNSGTWPTVGPQQTAPQPQHVDLPPELDELIDLAPRSGGPTSRIQEGESIQYKEDRPGRGGRGEVGDGMTPDHIPSNQALQISAQNKRYREEEERVRRPLTDSERKRLRLSKEEKDEINNNGWAIFISDEFHKKYSRTYGGRQAGRDSPTELKRKEQDARNLAEAARRDFEAQLSAFDPNLPHSDPRCLTRAVVARYVKHYENLANDADSEISYSKEINDLLLTYLRKARP
ncbi:toxin glutamine deamidase domain-containing protein [Streptomyces sp. NPDC001661]